MFNIKLYISILILLASLPLYSQDFCSFKYTDVLPQPCAGFASVKMPDGKIAAMGGYSYFLNLIPIASNLLHFYDPETETWRISRVRLATPRMYFDAVAMDDGAIIIAGGIGQDSKALDSVELYYPDLGNSPRETIANKVIGKMNSKRRNPNLMKLDDGRVLISGNNPYPEIIEKNADGQYTIRPAHGKMKYTRMEHSTVKLLDGRICFIAGRKKSIEIFDPKTETFELMTARFDSYYDDTAATVLYNGKVLIVGGQNIIADNCTNKTWLYDPKEDILTENITLVSTAKEISCSGISDLQIADLTEDIPDQQKTVFLLCGGEDDTGHDKDIVLDSAWLYLAKNDEFLEVGPMLEPHDDFKAKPLPSLNGNLRALIMSGHSTNDKITGHCEIFEISDTISSK